MASKRFKHGCRIIKGHDVAIRFELMEPSEELCSALDGLKYVRVVWNKESLCSFKPCFFKPDDPSIFVVTRPELFFFRIAGRCAEAVEQLGFTSKKNLRVDVVLYADDNGVLQICRPTPYQLLTADSTEPSGKVTRRRPYQEARA